MRNIYTLYLVLFATCLSCTPHEELVPESHNGYNMVLIGNSFFRPYAERIGELAIDAGYEDHKNEVVFRGGDNGRAQNLWNDNGEANRSIKEALDKGGVDFFGMTAGVLEENPTDGYRDWINYALQKNPDINIFISIPPVDFPMEWNETARELGFLNAEELFRFFKEDLIHKTLVDQLRMEFPDTRIFTIPTGEAAFNLVEMNRENLLLDDIEYFGSHENSLFVDEKGHQGEIVVQTGTLLWLESIYQIDLNQTSFETDFETDLQAIASEIMESHDPNYKQ